MGTTDRRLQLLAVLQASPGVSAPALAERFGTTERTIRRDVARLRELGYHIDGSAGPHGGYRLAAGLTRPPLALDDDEAVATGIGLRLATTAGASEVALAAVTALAKLQDGLPARVRARLAAAGDVAVGARPSMPPIDAGLLTICALACRANEALWLTYLADGARGPRGRDVQPHRLVHEASRWYLVAFDVRAAAWRTFRLDRVTRAQPTGTRWPTTPPPADPVAHVAGAIATGGWPHQVVVRLFVDRDTAAMLVDPTLGTLQEAPDGCLLEIRTDDFDWAARRVIALGLDLEVVGPPAFAEALEALGVWAQSLAQAALPPSA